MQTMDKIKTPIKQNPDQETLQSLTKPEKLEHFNKRLQEAFKNPHKKEEHNKKLKVTPLY